MDRVIKMVGKIAFALALRLRGAQTDSEYPNAAACWSPSSSAQRSRVPLIVRHPCD